MVHSGARLIVVSALASLGAIVAELAVARQRGAGAIALEVMCEPMFLLLTAGGAKAALEAVTEHQVDLVLLDLGLPGISGIELIRRLRHWTTVPIVVLSARDSEFDKIGALDAGADDYVAKPFDLRELMLRAQALLRRAAGGALVVPHQPGTV